MFFLQKDYTSLARETRHPRISDALSWVYVCATEDNYLSILRISEKILEHRTVSMFRRQYNVHLCDVAWGAKFPKGCKEGRKSPRKYRYCTRMLNSLGNLPRGCQQSGKPNSLWNRCNKTDCSPTHWAGLHCPTGQSGPVNIVPCWPNTYPTGGFIVQLIVSGRV